jgi:hypothetical protein
MLGYSIWGGGVQGMAVDNHPPKLLSHKILQENLTWFVLGVSLEPTSKPTSKIMKISWASIGEINQTW